MGIYINPKHSTKELWLMTHGISLNRVPEEIPEEEDLVIVCLVNNGAFTAAGVCFDQAELEAFQEPNDRRPKMWYLVGVEDLLKEGVKLPNRGE